LIASDIIAFTLDLMIQEELFYIPTNQEEPTDEEVEWANNIIRDRIENSSFVASEAELYELMQLRLKV